MSIGNLGLDIQVFAPLVQGAAPVGSLTELLSSYSHTLSADGLYKSADISLAGNEIDIADWLFQGLGRHIVVKNRSGIIRFSGFVDEMLFNLGNISLRVGPLMDIANRTLATYTMMTIIGGYVVKSGQTETVLVEDTASQAAYGIWEKVVNAGECYVESATGFNEANYIRDAYLQAFKSPKKTLDVASGQQGSNITISLTVKGYQEWLTAYLYQNRSSNTAALSITVTAKVQAALAADPNGVFSSDYSLLGACSGLQIDKQGEYKYANTVIESAVKTGDGTTRWLFQIDGNRRGVLRPANMNPVYSFSVVDNLQQFTDVVTGSPVDPWDVDPGLYYTIKDSVFGLASGDDNIGLGFIEEVSFTAPFQVSVSGEPFNLFQAYVNLKAGGGY